MKDWDAWINQGRTLVMGILNATADSFFGPSRILHDRLESVVDHAMTMVDQGADCLDIGAESTRPGAAYIDQKTEIERLLPVLQAIRKKVSVPISIDTRKAETARLCLLEGADIINDISGLRDDPGLASVVCKSECPVILMHMKGTPESMQENPFYEDCVDEVKTFLMERVAYARSAGIKHIMIDPGLGFGKRYKDNIDLLSHMDELVAEGLPVLIGASRKGFIGTCLTKNDVSRQVQDRLSGSLGVAAWSAMHGAAMVRVHDAGETADVVRVISCIKSGGGMHV